VLPVETVARLPARPPTQRWLVEQLWADEGVGIVGGEPKCCKSFLALDLAVAVASATPCLRRFAVPRAGRVLLFPAEDAHHVVQDRIRGICTEAGADFNTLDVHVITAPVLRLDHAAHRTALRDTVAALQPRLLILDPFVRLHRIDENLAGEVAPILAFLRELQREFHLSVLVVHHARKGAAHARAGQALRGSSDFHAWGDSNLYLRRMGDTLTLSVEHRAAPAASPLRLELQHHRGGTALHPLAATLPGVPVRPPDSRDRILDTLRNAATPLSLRAIRDASHIRTQTLSDAVKSLTAAGDVIRSPDGYRIPP
jgi:hypothetical protein